MEKSHEKSHRQYLQRMLAVLSISLIFVGAAASGNPSGVSEKNKASSLVPSQKENELQLATG